MDPFVKDLFQTAAWTIAVLGGLIAATKAIAEMRQSNQQRREDLRWKQAEIAKQFLDELMGDQLARAAMKMLDWSGLDYDLPDGKTTRPIDHESRRRALRISETMFPPNSDEPFIRDAFDSLLDNFERLEHFIRIGLIKFEDIERPLLYYVAKLADPADRSVIDLFIKAYGFEMADDFLSRFAPWLGTSYHGQSMRPLP